MGTSAKGQDAGRSLEKGITVLSELTKVFIAEYSSALSGLRQEAVRSKTEKLQKKKKLKVAINNIVDVVAPGHASAALLTKLTAFEEDLEALEKALKPQESAPLYFHPNLAKHYERLVYDLRALLNKPDCKQEAVTALRKFINRIDLVPSEEGLSIDIVGNLATMLQLTMPNMRNAASEETAFAITLVAGGTCQLIVCIFLKRAVQKVRMAAFITIFMS